MTDLCDWRSDEPAQTLRNGIGDDCLGAKDDADDHSVGQIDDLEGNRIQKGEGAEGEALAQRAPSEITPMDGKLLDLRVGEQHVADVLDDGDRQEDQSERQKPPLGRKKHHGQHQPSHSRHQRGPSFDVESLNAHQHAAKNAAGHAHGDVEPQDQDDEPHLGNGQAVPVMQSGRQPREHSGDGEGK